MSLVTEQHSMRNPRAGNQGLAVVDVSRHCGGSRDLADRRRPQRKDVRLGFVRDVAWSGCGRHMVEAAAKEIAYAGHADFDGF